MTEALARRLGLADAVVLGLSAMLGAGVFSALAPAAAAGPLLPALLLAGAVATCNALSSTRLAVASPRAGGAYVHGTERLGPGWGHLAGSAFVVGKTASCAAMALTVGAYLLPAAPRVPAVLAVAGLTALSLSGVQRSARLSRVLLALVLPVLALVVVAGLSAPAAPGPRGGDDVVQAAGLLFFAFAGYARIATLAEEVREPARTLPRAVPLALGLVLVVYALVALAVSRALGADLAVSSAPLAATVDASPLAGAVPLVAVGATAAAGGALLALLLGVSRTALAMARDGHLPRALGAVDPVHGVPRAAELAVAGAVVVLVLVADLRGAIGFSSFCVLAYYAVANAAALRLGRPVVPVLGLAGCVLLALSLPRASVLGGSAVLVGAVVVRAALRTGRS